MKVAQACFALLLAGCGHKQSALAWKPSPSPVTPATPTTGKLVLGDATVYDLLNSKREKRDAPAKYLVMHPDGKVEVYSGIDGTVLGAMFVKPDGSVTHARGRSMATIGEREIKIDDSRFNPLVVDGNTIIVTLRDSNVKVVLADDGNVTVLDRPEGIKWRIDAKDAAVRRTAFLVLGLGMQLELD